MGTYLEDFVDKIVTLPDEVKRNFALMRELDSVSADRGAKSAVP